MSAVFIYGRSKEIFEKVPVYNNFDKKWNNILQIPQAFKMIFGFGYFSGCGILVAMCIMKSMIHWSKFRYYMGGNFKDALGDFWMLQGGVLHFHKE